MLLLHKKISIQSETQIRACFDVRLGLGLFFKVHHIGIVEINSISCVPRKIETGNTVMLTSTNVNIY